MRAYSVFLRSLLLVAASVLITVVPEASARMVIPTLPTSLPSTETPLPSPEPSPTPRIPPPLPVRPPAIIAEAGILPSSIFTVFDRMSEVFERNVFSFGIPTLRARVALTQAAERIAEMQGLERNGELTPASANGLLEAQERLLAVADAVVARQFATGTVSPDLLLLLVRTRLATAEVLEELKDERAVFLELDAEPSPSPVPEDALPDAELPEPADDDAFADLGELLEGKIERLVEFEDAVIAPGVPTPPASVSQLLAEQKIAKAERDLLRAVRKTEERLAQGKVLIADAELRAAAESALLTARELFAAGNFSEALRLARDARRIADQLKSGHVAIEPEALRSENADQKINHRVQQLVEQGFLDAGAQQSALLRARQALDTARREEPTPAPVPPDDERKNSRNDEEERDEEESSDNSGSGSSGSGGSSSRRR